MAILVRWAYAVLLEKSIGIKQLGLMAVEILKTLNNLNSSYMKEVFSIQNTTRRKHKTLWQNSLSSFGPQICNSLPEHIRSKYRLRYSKTT